MDAAGGGGLLGRFVANITPRRRGYKRPKMSRKEISTPQLIELVNVTHGKLRQSER